MKNFSVSQPLKYVAFAFLLGMISCQSEPELNSSSETSATTERVTIDGKALFQANCASCHNPLKDATGPALKGSVARAPNKEWIYKFVHNSAKLISEGDPYANELYEKWNKTAMTAFPTLSNEEIDEIMKYCDTDYQAVP